MFVLSLCNGGHLCPSQCPRRNSVGPSTTHSMHVAIQTNIFYQRLQRSFHVLQRLTWFHCPCSTDTRCRPHALSLWNANPRSPPSPPPALQPRGQSLSDNRQKEHHPCSHTPHTRLDRSRYKVSNSLCHEHSRLLTLSSGRRTSLSGRTRPSSRGSCPHPR